MATPPYNILGTDTGRDALKTKVNDNFTDLYSKFPGAGAGARMESGSGVILGVAAGVTDSVQINFASAFSSTINLSIVVSKMVTGANDPSKLEIATYSPATTYFFIYIKNNDSIARDCYYSWIAVGI